MELENIIIRLEELKQEFDQLRPLREDRLNKLTQKLKLDWNYHSNSIEGNTLSMSETKSFILWGITAKGKPFRDYLEMKGHNEALNKLYQIISDDLKITESLIKEFHKLILVEPYADKEAEINPGSWKTVPNYLYTPTNERIDFAAPEDVPKMMNSLINWLNNHIAPPKRKKKKYDLHPLLIAAGFHSQFIKIHPFGDGNGRMARILTNLILMLCGYVPVVIKLDERMDYYTAINTSSLDDPENLAEFLGKEAINSLQIAIKAAKGESIEEEDDLDKELALLDKKMEAKKVSTPIVTQEKITELLNESIFPFFDQVFQDISEFDRYFESVTKQLFVDGGRRIDSSIPEMKEEVIDRCSKGILNSTHLYYEFYNLKNTAEKVIILVKLKVDFQRGSYVFSEELTKKELTLKYNQTISTEEQKAWIKNIQAEILRQINSIIDQ